MTELRFTRHALEKMFQRGISPEECERVFRQSKVIESYPEDKPFPSELRLGKVGDRTIHLVVSFGSDAVHVITAYEPDPKRWTRGFAKRRKRR